MADGQRSIPEGVPDVILMRRLSGGDLDSLGILFRRHYEAVVRLCARLTGQRDAGPDVAQETFVRVMRHRSTFNGRAQFRTWLYRIAYNAAMDHLRRERRRERLEREWTGEADREPADDQPRRALLEAGLARLRREQRDMITLTRFHGLSVKDAAGVVGCTPGAARVRLHRGLKDLRRICRELEHTP